MPYTTHGHWYGTGDPEIGKPGLVAKCGGPGMCKRCTAEALPALEPETRVTCYEVSCLPHASVNRRNYVIEVRLEREGWAVIHGMRYLGTDGAWSYGYGGNSADQQEWDAWMAGHHFDEKTALRLAQEAAPHITSSGMTPAQVLAWEATR